jgi:hypothetical protein
VLDLDVHLARTYLVVAKLFVWQVI